MKLSDLTEQIDTLVGKVYQKSSDTGHIQTILIYNVDGDRLDCVQIVCYRKDEKEVLDYEISDWCHSKNFLNKCTEISLSDFTALVKKAQSSIENSIFSLTRKFANENLG